MLKGRRTQHRQPMIFKFVQLMGDADFILRVSWVTPEHFYNSQAKLNYGDFKHNNNKYF